MYQGYALSISVGVINYVYVQMAQYFVDKSNLKYLQDYNNSLLNRLAVFKFVNIHLPIIYALIQFKRSIPELTTDQLSNYNEFQSELGVSAAESYKQQVFDNQTTRLMNQLILGNIQTQILSAFAGRYGLYFIMFKL